MNKNSYKLYVLKHGYDSSNNVMYFDKGLMIETKIRPKANMFLTKSLPVDWQDYSVVFFAKNLRLIVYHKQNIFKFWNPA